MRIVFEEVSVTAVRRWKDESGKRRQETRTFSQTLNPFNMNADGSVKSRDDIRRELIAERDMWVGNSTTNHKGQAWSSSKQTAHTPGPWRRSTGCDRWIVQESGGCIACVEQDGKVGEANARLIAAAPELLRVLTMVQATLPHIDGNASSVHSMLRDIDAAISAATKEQQ